MQKWYSIIPKSPMLSIYLWIIVCIMPFYFIIHIIHSFSLWLISVAVLLIILYFLSYYFSFNARTGLKYMWISLQMVLNILMTLSFGYAYFVLFTAILIGFNFKKAVGFYVMYGLNILFSIVTIEVGYFFFRDLFISQTPFIIITALGVVLVPFALYSKSRQENLEGELVTANERISELTVHEERQRIARDLHDTLGQKLSMIGLKSDLATRLVENNPQQAIQEIRDIRQTASIALKEVRELVADIRAIHLADELERVEQILKAAQIKFRLNGDASEIHMPVFAENIISMCLKEAVTNIVRHSQATICRISFYQSDEMFKLTIHDNGTGFPNAKRFEGGNGLKGIQERIGFINGSFHIKSDKGTTMIISVPVTITNQ